MKKKLNQVVKASAFYFIIFVTLVFSSAIEARAEQIAKRDAKQIKSFVACEYGNGYKIRIKEAEKTSDKTLANRKGKRIIYVDQFTTKSKGKYGIVIRNGRFNGRKIKYNSNHKKGKIIKVYWLYNPYSNFTDDVIAVIETGKTKVISQ